MHSNPEDRNTSHRAYSHRSNCCMHVEHPKTDALICPTGRVRRAAIPSGDAAQRQTELQRPPRRPERSPAAQRGVTEPDAAVCTARSPGAIRDSVPCLPLRAAVRTTCMRHPGAGRWRQIRQQRRTRPDPGPAAVSSCLSARRWPVSRAAGRSWPRRAGVAAVALVLVVTLTGCVVRHGALPRLGSGQCKGGDPLAGVYLPSRLHVEKNCLTVTGTVTCVTHEPHGDVHILVQLARRYRGSLPRPMRRSTAPGPGATDGCSSWRSSPSAAASPSWTTARTLAGSSRREPRSSVIASASQVLTCWTPTSCTI
jgi:hypothetical protein